MSIFRLLSYWISSLLLCSKSRWKHFKIPKHKKWSQRNMNVMWISSKKSFFANKVETYKWNEIEYDMVKLLRLKNRCTMEKKSFNSKQCKLFFAHFSFLFSNETCVLKCFMRWNPLNILVIVFHSNAFYSHLSQNAEFIWTFYKHGKVLFQYMGNYIM